MIQKLSIAVDSISYNDGASGKVELFGNRIVGSLAIGYTDEFRQKSLKIKHCMHLDSSFSMSIESPVIHTEAEGH